MDKHRNFVSGFRTGTSEWASQETLPGMSVCIRNWSGHVQTPGRRQMPSTGAGFCLYLCVSKRSKDRLCYPLCCHSTLFSLILSPLPRSPYPYKAQINKRATRKGRQVSPRSLNSYVPHWGTLPSVLQLARKGLTQKSLCLTPNEILIHGCWGRMWKRGKINHRTSNTGVWEG